MPGKSFYLSFTNVKITCIIKGNKLLVNLQCFTNIGQENEL